MSTSKTPDQKEPALYPGRAIRALQEQLDGLQKLKDRKYQEAELEETEWEHVTQGIVEAAFGDPSSALSKFHVAKKCSPSLLKGTSPQQSQRNLIARMNQQEALLRGLIRTLRLQLPEEDMKAV